MVVQHLRDDLAEFGLVPANHEIFLGVKPPIAVASAIARGLRRPEPPYMTRAEWKEQKAAQEQEDRPQSTAAKSGESKSAESEPERPKVVRATSKQMLEEFEFDCINLAVQVLFLQYF